MAEVLNNIEELVDKNEKLIDIWGRRNPKFEIKYEKTVMRAISDYGVGASENTSARGKVFGSGYEPYIMAFFIGLYAGKITKVTSFNSTVKLITSDDVNNKISVKIKVNDKYVYGLLSGYDKKKQTFIVEGISDNTEIPKDATVTTTGMGDSFPSGIVVGKVKRVTTDNFDLAKTVEVTSSVDYDDLSFVTILKRNDQ